MIHVMYYIKHSAMGDGQFHLTDGKLQAICRYVATEPAWTTMYNTVETFFGLSRQKGITLNSTLTV